jgi:DNA modification methylase
MTPYYADDAVTIYHGDCREWTGSVDAVVSDPPYGMRWDTDTTRFSGGAQKVKRGRDWKVPIAGDAEPFDPARWLEYPHVVLFGSNHYAARLPVGTTLVWLKRYDEAFGSFLSDAEIAWRKGGHGVYVYRSIRGPMATDHPTQKPVDLMRWSIEKAGGTGTVLDPFMGSGTTLVAAKSLGRKAIGIEIEERYCEIAANRCRQEVLGLVG